MTTRQAKRHCAGGAVLSTIALALAAVLWHAGSAGAQGGLPTPDPNFAVDLAPRPCALDTDDPYQAKFYEIEGWQAPAYERYPGACTRMKFVYGPIPVKPGQNDVLAGPVTIEKPSRDGYVTRFKPNLIRADGTVPPVEQIHLHHANWLSVPTYGSFISWMASGEEKTISPWPRGYGMPIKATDVWALGYMVHSAVSEPMEVYITYEIDFVPQDKAEELGMKPAYPVWLDVRPSGYPVFNVQRGFGGADGTCTWPKEQCADFDPYGKKIVGQGEPGNGIGEDLALPQAGEPLGQIAKFTGGTLIGIGGHLHPGGLTNDIDLVRPGGEDVQVKRRYRVKVKRRYRVNGKTRYRMVTKTRCKRYRRVRGARACARRVPVYRTKVVTERRDTTRIYTGRAWYWDRQDKSKPGGPPTSWDFSMEVMGLPYWGVEVKPGDKLRSNATYDTTYQATYENMGIAIALLAPHDENGKPTAPGVNPFQAKEDNTKSCRSGGVKANRLCTRGLVTHGHYKENGNYGGPSGEWTAAKGPATNEIAIADFLYTPGDLSTKSSVGIPQVKLGSNLRFTNLEAATIYHTITTCKFPCLGQTGAAFPLADGETSKGRKLDLDSSELAFGPSALGPQSNRADYTVPVTPEAGFEVGEIVTYFCRVHPFMRGAFEVTE